MIEAKCFLINEALKGIGVQQEDIPARMMFDPNEVFFMRELIDNETQEISQKECVIHFKSGISVVADLSYNEMRKFLNQKQQ